MGKQLNVENSVISAKDDAFFYNAMIQKNGVWQYGNKLDYEIISANQINIKDGMVTAQGRNYVIYPNEVDSLTIENGTVNTKRNDLIVYEVSKTSEGEQVGLKVIKGTNATTPTDPTLTQDDTLASGSKYQMPLYRVRLNGINIEGVDDLRKYIVSFGNLVNDNLLINSDFRNPINQRRQTSYQNPISVWTYTVDRWCMWDSNTIMNIVDGGIEIITGNPDILQQPLETPLINGETYTLTVKINGTIYTKQVVGGTREEFNGFGIYYGHKGNFDSISIYLESNSTYIIEYIKLEQGSIATPFVTRPYAEELALCQRYYQRFEKYPIYTTSTSGFTYYGLQLYTPMRTIPTIGSCKFYNSSAVEQTSVSYNSAVINTYNIIYVKLSGNIGQYGMMTCDLDAEIY